MASSSSSQFIDYALSPMAIFQLSYPYYQQKWIIKTHLISFLYEFSSFSPSIDNFTHDDGRTVILMKVKGDLRVSDSSPLIPITIWLHENYPYEPPIVFVSSLSAASRIRHDHPFVQPSGLTIAPFLLAWIYPGSNISQLVWALIKLFNLHYPFEFSCNSFSFGPPSAMSRYSGRIDDVEPNAHADHDLIEQLSDDLQYDMVALTSKTQQEMEDLLKIQMEMFNRKMRAESLILALDHEKSVLEEKVEDLRHETEVLKNWLEVNEPKYLAGNGNGKDESFEGADEISKLGIECLAADNAIEDLIYALGKAVEEGLMSFDMCMKMVRCLGREQFVHRATLARIDRVHLLHWAHSSTLLESPKPNRGY